MTSITVFEGRGSAGKVQAYSLPACPDPSSPAALPAPPFWTSLTSVFHSALYLAFLPSGLGQLGKNLLGKTWWYFQGVSLSEWLSARWKWVGGLDSCRRGVLPGGGMGQCSVNPQPTRAQIWRLLKLLRKELGNKDGANRSESTLAKTRLCSCGSVVHT